MLAKLCAGRLSMIFRDAPEPEGQPEPEPPPPLSLVPATSAAAVSGEGEGPFLSPGAALALCSSGPQVASQLQ